MPTFPANPVSTILQRGIRIVTAAGAVTVTTADGIIAINKTVGAATAVSLPQSPPTNWACIVSDKKFDSGTNAITVTPAGGVTINGQANFVINTNGLAKGFAWDGVSEYLAI